MTACVAVEIGAATPARVSVTGAFAELLLLLDELPPQAVNAPTDVASIRTNEKVWNTLRPGRLNMLTPSIDR
jgi:hypothetical protein